MKYKHLTLGLLITSSLFSYTAFAGCAPPAFPNSSVTKTCALATDGDKNGNGLIDPGDILECTVTISNSGNGNDTISTVTDTSDDLEFQDDQQYDNGGTKSSIDVTVSSSVVN